MEAEAEKLKEMQNDVEKQMALSPPAGVFEMLIEFFLIEYYIFV